MTQTSSNTPVMIPHVIKDPSGKMKADCFIHIMQIDVAPKSVDKFPYEVLLEDPAKVQFKALVMTYARCRLRDLSSIETFASAGLERSEFISKFMANKPEANLNTELVIFVFKKI